jgi:two-component system sensor histidine kinase YesM
MKRVENLFKEEAAMYELRHSVYRRLIFLFAVIVIPYLAVGSFILIKSNEQIRTEHMNGEKNATHHLITQLNADIENIYATNFLLFSQSNTLKLSNQFHQLSSWEQMTMINTLREQLTSLNSSNSLTQHLRIHLKDWKRVFNSSGYPLGSFQEITSDEYKVLCSEVPISRLYIPSHTQSPALSILIPEDTSPLPGAVIEAVLSTSVIKDRLEELSDGQNDYYFLSAAEGAFCLSNLPDNLLPFMADFIDKTPFQGDAVTLMGTSYVVFSEDLSVIHGTFIRIIDYNKLFAPMQTLTTYTLIFLAIVALSYLAFWLVTRSLIRRPLSVLIAGLSEMEKGNYSIRIPYHSKTEFSHLYQGFNRMAMKINQSIERDYKNKLLLQQAEYGQLQAQINPHFLYNSFFMLHRTIKGGLWDESMEITRLLGTYFQYITKNANALVTLIEDYNHAKAYAQIQQMRFDGRIRANFDSLPVAFEQLPIPKLILQPIIENAYKYALENKSTEGLLRVSTQVENEKISIFIEDNGDGLTNHKLEQLKKIIRDARICENMEMTGLMNISRRLSIFSMNRACLHIDRSVLGGLCVCICIDNREDATLFPTQERKEENESTTNC